MEVWLKQLLELMSIIAVILTLILVAYEIGQNKNAMAAQAVFEINDSGRESLFDQINNAELDISFI